MTRIQTTFIFFFLLYSISAQSNAPSTPLNTAVNDLEIIARLVNGIAVQTKLEKNPRKVDEIVAEFLGVSEGEHIRNLRNLSVDALVEDLKLLFQNIETQIPNPTTPDIRKIVRTIESLSQFQSDVAILKPGGVPDPKTDLEGQLNSVKNNQSLRTAITEFFDEGHWINTKKLLENFKVEDGQSAGSRTARSAIATLQSGFSKAQGYCGRLKMKNSSEFHPVLELITLKEKLRGVDALATLSEAYLRDVADFKALHVTLDPLKFDVTNFRASLTNLTSFKPIVQLTQRAQNLIETLTLASQGNANRKKNTNGFSRGISDVSLMFDDLNVSATMKKLVSRGKELTNMTIALTPMRSFLTKFQEVSAAWNETFNGSGRSNFSKMAKILEDTWNASEPILENLELESTITSAINCTRDLADPTSSWDPVAYQQVSDFGIKLIGKIEIFNETLESVTGLICDKLIIKSSELESLLTINKQSEAKDQWDLVRNWTELDSLIDIYSRINSTLTEGKLNSPMDVLDENWSLDEVPKVVDSFSGTMLPETLECLKNTSHLVEGILEVEEFQDKLRVAKLISISISASNTSSMQAVYQHIGTIILVKQKMLEVQEVFEKKVALRLDLNDAESLSADLGSGVDSLRELVKMHAPDIAFKINNVIRAGTEINLIIDNISGVDQVWNNENRQLLNDILRELRELEQEVRTMKQDTMDQVWKVFERAEKRLKGHDIDSRVFGDPIAAALERAAKIYIRDVAKSFRAVAELDLNFAQHNVYLKAAHGTLQPIQKFFDLFFGNAEAIGDTTTSEATGNDSGAGFYWIILLSFVAVVSILAIIGTIAYRISEARLLKTRRLDPERYWVYQTPQCHPTDATWLPMACFANKTDLARKLVKDGQNVDTFYKGKSCLHWAITHQNPEMLELLIKHGADRSVQDKDFLDAKAALEAVISGKLSSEKVATPPATTGNAEKCARVMRKYEKSKFLPYVPKLPPISSFSISICDDYHGSFAENYPKLVYSEDTSSRRTHNVVKCNEDGVFDIDEVAEVKKADLAEHDPKKPKVSTLERIDMEMIEKRRRLVNLVFDFALMVDMKWLDECVKDKKAFYDDYEKYRVRKVKYGGKIYQSVDLWRKWMCDRAIPCLEDGIVYFHLAETKKSSCMTGETVGARVIENYSDAMIEAANRTGPAHLYWDPECPSMLIVQVDGVQSEDWFGNMQVFKNNTKQLVEDEYYQYLLEQTGVGKLDEEGAGKRGARGSNERKSSKKSSNESAASVQSTVELGKK